MMQINNPGKSLRQQEFTASGTWVAPIGVLSALVTVIAGGGGGGSGRLGNPAQAGGGGGGASGDMIIRMPVIVAPGSSYSVQVGVGGIGGAAITVFSNDGLPGTNGSSSYFGSGVYASGGKEGEGGNGTTLALGGLKDIEAGLGSYAAISNKQSSGGDGHLQADGARAMPGVGITSGLGGLAYGVVAGGGGSGGGGFSGAYPLNAGRAYGGNGSTSVGENGDLSNIAGNGGGGGGGSNGTASGAGGDGAPGYVLVEWWQ